MFGPTFLTRPYFIAGASFTTENASNDIRTTGRSRRQEDKEKKNSWKDNPAQQAECCEKKKMSERTDGTEEEKCRERRNCAAVLLSSNLLTQRVPAMAPRPSRKSDHFGNSAGVPAARSAGPPRRAVNYRLEMSCCFRRRRHIVSLSLSRRYDQITISAALVYR